MYRQQLLPIILVTMTMMACSPASTALQGDGTAEAEPGQAASSGTPAPASDEGIIQKAMTAAPPDLAANATIEDPDATGNMRVLRQGSNGWVCRVQPFIMCLDGPWQAFMAARAKKTAPQVAQLGISYMLQGDGGASNVDPFATGPTADNDWVVTGPHLMIITPDASDLEALPDSHRQGGPWVMWKGTPYAHIMAPIGSGITH